MKNAFYFTLKALFIFKIFDKKDMINSKFLTSQPRKQTISIHILSNISRSKDNHANKLGQLIETFFLKNHTQNVVEKLFSDSFLKIHN